MSNLRLGFETNLKIMEKVLSNRTYDKYFLLKIYGNLKVIEYRAFDSEDSELAYEIQNVLLDLEKNICD